MWLKYLSSWPEAKAYMRKFRLLTAEEFQTSTEGLKVFAFCILTALTLSHSLSVKSHSNFPSINVYLCHSPTLILTFLFQQSPAIIHVGKNILNMGHICKLVWKCIKKSHDFITIYHLIENVRWVHFQRLMYKLTYKWKFIYKWK